MSAITPTKAQFGFLGGLAMNAAGKKIIESHDVADPASSVSRSLAGQLATIFGGEALPPGGVVEGRTPPRSWRRAATRMWWWTCGPVSGS